MGGFIQSINLCLDFEKKIHLEAEKTLMMENTELVLKDCNFHHTLRKKENTL